MDISTEGLLALVTVLERENWTYRTYWEFVRDDLNVVTKQVLKAVFFTNDPLIKQARRFCPDWMIQVDGTFNTNKIRMPLIDCLGVNNTGRSFIFAFCFVTSESAENWGFVLQCLEQTVFDGLPLPRVVIADQGLGLRSVFKRVWPSCILQFCEWHAAMNVKKRLAQKRYKKEERDAIMRLVWAYVKSASEQDLETNRAAMMESMKPGKKAYINVHWRPREKQVIRCYTSLFLNLNCFTTQREEGQHPMVKTVLNHQLRLDEAVLRLNGEMTLAVERLQEAEQHDQARNRRVLEANSWYLVREVVASWPLLVLEKEWAQLARFKTAHEALPTPCLCGLVERFGLPCSHYLERAWDEALPLPLTLIHSRWWYRGGIENRAGWQPTYSDQPRVELRPLRIERPRLEIVSATNDLLTYRETLSREQQDLLDEAQVRSTAQTLSDSRARQHLSTIPQTLPAPIISTWNRHAKSHDKVAKRMMTSAEAAVQDADRAEKLEAARKREEEAAIDDELLGGIEHTDSDGNHSEIRETVFSTPISPPRATATGTMLPPPRLTTPPGTTRKRTFTLVSRTPEKPRGAPIVPITPSAAVTRKASPLTSTPRDPAEIAASTAPPRLDGRTRREGKNSVYKKAIAIERGRGRGQGRGGQGGRE
jgi:hypothetical protein